MIKFKRSVVYRRIMNEAFSKILRSTLKGEDVNRLVDLSEQFEEKLDSYLKTYKQLIENHGGKIIEKGGGSFEANLDDLTDEQVIALNKEFADFLEEYDTIDCQEFVYVQKNRSAADVIALKGIVRFVDELPKK